MSTAGRRCSATRTRRIPVPRPGEVLVRVGACALNHLDLWQRRGIERVTIPVPAHLRRRRGRRGRRGADGRVSPGQRVMLQPGLACGRCAACLEGRDNECPRYDVLGYQSDGGYAEFVRVPVQNLIALPDAIGFVEAAAFPLTFLTAWHMLVTRARLQAGELVLVLGAGQRRGPGRHPDRAAARRPRDRHRRAGREAGARPRAGRLRGRQPHHGRRAAAVRRADRRPRRGRRGRARRAPPPGTRASSAWRAAAGWSPAAPPPVTTRASTCASCSAASCRCSGRTWGEKGELIRAAEHFFRGELVPVVDRIYPLAEAAEAHRRLESREAFGKIVLAV